MKKINSIKFLIVITAIAFALPFQSIAQKNDAKLSLETSVAFGRQKNNLTILVSDNLKSDYDLKSLRKTKWIDVTKLFALGSTADFSPSGEVDLSKFQSQGKQLYIAFRYIGESSEKPTQRSWSVQNIILKGTGLDKIFQFSDFNIINSTDNSEGAGWVKRSDNGIRYISNRSTTETESWAVLKLID